MNTNFTSETVLATANNLLKLLAVINPGAAGAAVAVQGALTFLTSTVLPEVARLVQGGQVSIAEQAQIRAAYEAYRANFEQLFQGPEWEIRPDPQPPAGG